MFVDYKLRLWWACKHCPFWCATQLVYVNAASFDAAKAYALDSRMVHGSCTDGCYIRTVERIG